MQCYQLIFVDEKLSHCESLQILARFYCLLLPFVFMGKLIAMIMMSRSKCNSQVAAFHAMISPPDIETLAANSSLPSTSSSEPPATSHSLTLDQPCPAFLASVVSAVKQALAAERLQASNLPKTPAASFATSLPKAAALGAFLVRLCPLASLMPKLRS